MFTIASTMASVTAKPRTGPAPTKNMMAAMMKVVTFASRMAEKLANVLELSAVTGHRDVRMLKRYYHPRAEDLARKLG